MDPGAVLAGAARRPEPGQPRLGHDAVRRDRRHRHRRGRRTGGRRPAHQGQPQGARGGHRLPGGGGGPRSLARAPPWRSPSAPATSPSPAPGRWASPTASTSATRATRGVLALHRVGARARATPAGRSACRSPAATSASTTQSPSGAILPTAQIGIVGLLEDVERRVSTRLPTGGRPGRPRRRGVARAGRLGLRGAGRRRAGRPAAGPRPGARGGAPAVAPGGGRGELLASAQDVSGGGLAVALAECAIWSGLGARLQVAVGSTPSVDLFGESPGRRRGDRRPGPLGGARWPAPASSACPSGGWAWWAASGCASTSSARAPRAPPRSAARASPMPSTSTCRSSATPGGRRCHAALGEVA